MSIKEQEEKDDLLQVNEALSRSEQFIENNKKSLLIALAVIVLVVGGVFLFRNGYLKPKEKEAQAMIFMGESYFAVDSFQIALNGDGGEYIGFESIIDDYGITKTAKLAAAYAGLCYKSMGNYEKAIDYLDKCNSKDIMVSPALKGAIGDCYVELKELDKAADYFTQAASAENNVLSPLYLMKAGRVYEAMDKWGQALKVYEQIRDQYPLSQEGTTIEKYIERAKLKK
jgi:tetratricopeptide (TPR) repeat protein